MALRLPFMSKMPVGPIDREAVIAGYLQFEDALSRRQEDSPGPYDRPDLAAAERSHDLMRRIIRHGPAPVAWEMVKELLRRAPNEQLAAHAVGPLEDLVCRRGSELVDQIETEAADDARFRWALGCVWLSDADLPSPVLERIVRASGDVIKPLRKGEASRSDERVSNREDR